MADPAVTQIVAALRTRWLGLSPAVNVFVDRDDSEPIQDHERPAIVIRVVDVALDERMEMGDSAQVHALTIDTDLYLDADVVDNLSAQHNLLASRMVAKIGEDWTLGGKVFEFTPMSFTASADVVPAAGVGILTWDAKTQTALWDWTDIRI